MNPNDNQTRQHNEMYTYWPLEVCNKRVTSVEVAGTRQLLASKAYLNSSSQTTCSEKKKAFTLYIQTDRCDLSEHAV